MANEQKNLVVAVVTVVAAGVLIVVVDLVEEDELENAKTLGRLIPGLLGLFLDQVLQHRLSPDHYLLRLYHTRLPPLSDLETGGATADQNDGAKKISAGPLHEQKFSRKMDLRKINGQFLSLSW